MVGVLSLPQPGQAPILNGRQDKPKAKKWQGETHKRKEEADNPSLLELPASPGSH
jgi:hypothetical protein